MNKHKIEIDDIEYRIFEDDYSNDWCVVSDDDETVQQDWLYSKYDAIEYVLAKSGIVEDGFYQFAPDRT